MEFLEKVNLKRWKLFSDCIKLEAEADINYKQVGGNILSEENIVYLQWCILRYVNYISIDCLKEKNFDNTWGEGPFLRSS